MTSMRSPQKDAYEMILEAIDTGTYKPGSRLVESELAERFGVSRTPIREALQRLETQSLLSRDGRSLIVASLDHSQLSELYVVRGALEGLAARLAARHSTPEELAVLRHMLEADRALVGDPDAMSRANHGFISKFTLPVTIGFWCSSLILCTAPWRFWRLRRLRLRGVRPTRWSNTNGL
jgi:DNA-binding GntR family transcriptional regulator